MQVQKKLKTNLFHRTSKYLDQKEAKYYRTNRWNDETTEILHMVAWGGTNVFLEIYLCLPGRKKKW